MDVKSSISDLREMIMTTPNGLAMSAILMAGVSFAALGLLSVDLFFVVNVANMSLAFLTLNDLVLFSAGRRSGHYNALMSIIIFSGLVIFGVQSKYLEVFAGLAKNRIRS